jgi:RNA polymerase sigma-70 factor (sigma-E family)
VGVVEVRASFEEYVRARTHALLRVAYLVTGDAYDAEDLVQSALAAAATRWSHLTDPEAYLRRSIYTKAISRWRYRTARPPETLTATPPESAATPDHDTRLVLLSALRRLTPKQRAVLVLRYYEDRTEVEAAILLGVSTGTVKSQTRHALRRLRELAPELADLMVEAR